MRDRLVDGVHFAPRELTETLSADLVARLDSIVEGLGYIGETGDEAEIDYNLQYTQFWRNRGADLRKQGILGEAMAHAYEEWKAAGHVQFSLQKIKSWPRRSEAVAR